MSYSFLSLPMSEVLGQKNLLNSLLLPSLIFNFVRVRVRVFYPISNSLSCVALTLSHSVFIPLCPRYFIFFSLSPLSLSLSLTPTNTLTLTLSLSLAISLALTLACSLSLFHFGGHPRFNRQIFLKPLKLEGQDSKVTIIGPSGSKSPPKNFSDEKKFAVGWLKLQMW